MKNLREEEWARTVDVLCKGALNCVGAVRPGMLGRGRGHIVTISSDAGRKVFPSLAVYSASNYFVEALCKTSVATDLLSLSGDEQALEIYGGTAGAGF